MSHEGKGSPADWLRHAHSDLALARAGRAPEVLLEALCFHAQQAAEKALKAVILSRGVPVLRTHNLRTLLDLIPEAIGPPGEVQEAASLTEYAVLIRYPAEVEPVSEQEYRDALRLAEGVVRWAEGVIGAASAP